MFHCNGWCFPRTIAALAGTNVCFRRVEPKASTGKIQKYVMRERARSRDAIA
jgi:fatty-acyl-CoA synthase